jgi:hypothetical protein
MEKTLVFYKKKKDDEITGLDTIHCHNKGLIPSQGTVPLLQDLVWPVSGGAIESRIGFLAQFLDEQEVK